MSIWRFKARCIPVSLIYHTKREKRKITKRIRNAHILQKWVSLVPVTAHHITFIKDECFTFSSCFIVQLQCVSQLSLNEYVMLCYGKLDSEVSRRVGRGFAAAVTQATGTSATAGCACPEPTRCRVPVNISLRSACRIAAPRCMYACMYVCRSVRPSVRLSLARCVCQARHVRASAVYCMGIVYLSAFLPAPPSLIRPPL